MPLKSTRCEATKIDGEMMRGLLSFSAQYSHDNQQGVAFSPPWSPWLWSLSQSGVELSAVATASGALLVLATTSLSFDVALRLPHPATAHAPRAPPSRHGRGICTRPPHRAAVRALKRQSDTSTIKRQINGVSRKLEEFFNGQALEFLLHWKQFEYLLKITFRQWDQQNDFKLVSPSMKKNSPTQQIS